MRMTNAPPRDPWQWSIERLDRWHTHADRDALEEVLRFLSEALPELLAPRLVRKLGGETTRDLVQEFLLGLQRKPLPTCPEHPRTYLGRALQNRALSLMRRKDAELVAVVPEPPLDHAAPAQERQTAAREVLRALQMLPMEDRVALKLSEAPEVLDDDEFEWLVARAGVPREEAQARALRAASAEERAQLFEGGREPLDECDVGRAINRFHKRVSRARQKLLTLLGGER
jgi:DNA-directed RNA polymerase specialized sigma24 family protein